MPQPIFRDTIVRPGHPLVLGCLIMQAYSSLAAAMHRPTDAMVCAALKDERISGTGHAVYAALDVLKRGFVVGVESAIAYADVTWQQQTVTAYAGSRVPGQLQADSLKAQFRELFLAWAETDVG